MKIGEGSECYEQSKCLNGNNQEIVDNLDYIIGLLTQATNKLLYSRIRIQRETGIIEPCYPHCTSESLEHIQSMAEGVKHCSKALAEQVKRCTPANIIDVDPSEYNKT